MITLLQRPSKPIDMSGRVLKPELLQSADQALAETNLRDIARINRWFGGHRALLRVLNGLAPRGKAFSVLDVGAASGDMGNCIRRHFQNATVVSLDHQSFHLDGASGPQVVADPFRLPFRPNAFDFVLCSSVLHHFSDCEAVELIDRLRPFGRRALIVLDLERHPVAYHFLPLTKRLFGWSPLTVHDGPVSVAAGFRPEELGSLARAAGFGAVTVRRHWPGSACPWLFQLTLDRKLHTNRP